jgi:hypothetical protein
MHLLKVQLVIEILKIYILNKQKKNLLTKENLQIVMWK